RPVVAGLLGVSGLALAGLLVAVLVAWDNAERRAKAVQDLEKADKELQQKGLALKQLDTLAKEKVQEAQRAQESAEQARQSAKVAQGSADLARRIERQARHTAAVQFAQSAWERSDTRGALRWLKSHPPQAGEDLRSFEWYHL